MKTIMWTVLEEVAVGSPTLHELPVSQITALLGIL